MVSTTWRCTVSYEVCLYYAEAEEDGRYQQKPSDVTFWKINLVIVHVLVQTFFLWILSA